MTLLELDLSRHVGTSLRMLADSSNLDAKAEGGKGDGARETLTETFTCVYEGKDTEQKGVWEYLMCSIMKIHPVEIFVERYGSLPLMILWQYPFLTHHTTQWLSTQYEGCQEYQKDEDESSLVESSNRSNIPGKSPDAEHRQSLENKTPSHFLPIKTKKKHTNTPQPAPITPPPIPLPSPSSLSSCNPP